MKGSYALIVEIAKDTKIRVSELGEVSFAKGFYIYVGSALKNLEKRIRRHLSDEKKFHWHIDYLLQFALVRKTLYKESERREECEIAERLSEKFPCIKGFGCSDCNCKSHLFYSKDLESAENECKKMGMKIWR